LDVSNKQLALANEELKLHDKMQEEFINIAAHEPRNRPQRLRIGNIVYAKCVVLICVQIEDHYIQQRGGIKSPVRFLDWVTSGPNIALDTGLLAFKSIQCDIA
jgi:hypothetical protein